jgi:hypothetical protein
MELTLNETNLVSLIRNKYRYGEITIVCHDGKPVRIKKADAFDDLHGDLSDINNFKD